MTVEQLVQKAARETRTQRTEINGCRVEISPMFGGGFRLIVRGNGFDNISKRGDIQPENVFTVLQKMLAEVGH